ncbi:S9 family peptidase, partial [candidate division WOR-3 bacterium]|nr:S9 family peptidase [candidate division WOR-3 bacterium]
MRFFNRILIIITLSIISCTGNRYFTTKKNVSEERIKPPVAKIVPHETVMHGEKLIDNYSWLKDKTRTDPDVIDYLKAENEYTEKMLKHTEKVQEELFNEILSRIKETDLNVPTKIDNYYYYSRREKGKQYMIFCRKKESLDADEEIILDVNELAEGYSFFHVRSTLMSTNHRYLAYLADTTGAEKFALYIKDLRTGELLNDKAYPVNNIAWANDNRTLFYTIINEKKQADKLYRHTLGTDIKDDKLMYQENDGAFYVYIYKTRSKEYLIMGTGNVITSENRYLKAAKPLDEFKLIQSREKGVRYHIAHHSDKFFIKTNANEAKNYKIIVTSVDNPSKENWKEFIAHRDSVFITGYDVFKDYMVVYEREKGLEKPRIINFNTKKTHYVEFPEPVYGIYSESNPNFDTDLLRFAYTSLTTPWSIFDYNMKTKKRELKKQYEVLGGYDATQYKSERIFAKAKDG